MKFLLLYLLITACLLSTCFPQTASLQKEPAKILNALALKYPSAVIQNWKFKNNVYSVKFNMDSKKSTAYFDLNGSWLSTETRIPWSWKLPIAVTGSFNQSTFASWYIVSIRRVETPEKIFYRLTVDNGNELDVDHHDVFLKKYIVDFSHEGLLLSKAREE